MADGGTTRMETVVYMNGEFVPRSEAKVSVYDHGLLYGDGVFEGIRAYNGRVFKLERHVERLFQSAKSIALTIPHSPSELRDIILEACRRNRIVDGYVRPLVTRGVGDLGLDPRKCKEGATVVVIAVPLLQLYPPEVYERGLKVVTSSWRRISPQTVPPSIKSMNYLNNILARIEANQADADEALLLDLQGYVSEATADNFLIVANHAVWAPPTETNLPGVTRETALNLCDELDIRWEEKLFSMYNVYAAREAFITGTAAEIAPVVQVDGRAIGDGKPGKITRDLMKAYRELVTTTGTPIPK